MRLPKGKQRKQMKPKRSDLLPKVGETMLFRGHPYTWHVSGKWRNSVSGEFFADPYKDPFHDLTLDQIEQQYPNPGGRR